MLDAFEIIKRKMCEIAGVEYDTVTWSDGSHLKMYWTEEQEETFKKWLADEIMRNAEFRNRVSAFRALARRRSYANKIADEFCMNYGFRLLH